MEPVKIKIELMESGISQADIARRCHPPVKRQMVNQVISGKIKSKRVEQAIASALGLDVEQVFPSRSD